MVNNSGIDKAQQMELEGNSLMLLPQAQKKASKNDTPLEKEMRKFNKLVKELQEQEKQNALQQEEDEKYQTLFFSKVHPLLVSLATAQLSFIEKLESIFYANKFSKNRERTFVAFAIPILLDASLHLEAAAEKMNNYINWQSTLFSKPDDTPVASEQNGDEDLNEEEWDFGEDRNNTFHKKPEKEAVDANEKKSISDLYKELAKLIHPDLEQDEAIRYRKEQLMKELTLAKDKEDVHAMLLIRQKADLINKTSTSEKSYSLQMLKMYNNSLKKKLENLKRTLHQKIYNSFGSKASFYAHDRKKISVESRIKNDIGNIKELQENLQANTRIITTSAHLRELLDQL